MAYLVPDLVELLVSVILHESKHEMQIGRAIKKEVKNLIDNLRSVKLELMDAEKRQWKESEVKEWFSNFNEICYELEDVLEVWSTLILKSHNTIDECNHSHSMRKVCSLSTYFSLFRGKNGQRHEIASKIRYLNKRLDDVVMKKCHFNFNFKKSIEVLERPITSPVIDESTVKGREKEKNELINKLTSQSIQGSIPHIITIVGMGGMGKTTLAQIAYNDSRINAYFDIKIWVCVSNPFDETKVANGILNSVELKDEKGRSKSELIKLKDGKDRSKSEFIELKDALKGICQLIEGKKFLLILDNVWEENPLKWKTLSDCLKNGLPESKILVTTRKQEVASMMECTDTIPLGVLPENECWSLFSQLAFSGKSERERDNLQEIGKQIVEGCKGLPLAIKTIGSLLAFKRSREEWESVLSSEEWELEAKTKLFGPLLLSYYDLPPKVRQCFSYCAISPKDCKFIKEELICMWMAQGYIKATQSKEMEIIGEEYFEILAARSFFQDFKKDEHNRIVECKMHDIVHDFAQFLTKNESIVVKVRQHGEAWSDSYNDARHLIIEIDGEVKLSNSFNNFRKLRSLVVKGMRNILALDFNQFTCLRILILYGSSFDKFPSGIEKLIHLRFLGILENVVLKELPDAICELQNLQFLVLWGCNKLVKLPRGIGKLINLRYLSDDGTLISHLPKGLERLTSLRGLALQATNPLMARQSDIVITSDDVGEETFTLGGLKWLNQHQGSLDISGLGNVRDVSEAEKAQLKQKIHITSLTLQFGGTTELINDVATHDEVLQALEPPLNLETLNIEEHKGLNASPNWLTSLTKLKKIVLGYLKNCKQLPPLGKLPSLEHLDISHMDKVEKVGNEFFGTEANGTAQAFPSLKFLYFDNMVGWEEWDVGGWRGPNGMENEDHILKVTIMPSLQILSISSCPKLKVLPVQILQTTSLKELKIRSCPQLKSRYGKKSGENWHCISHIPLIEIDYERERPRILALPPQHTFRET